MFDDDPPTAFEDFLPLDEFKKLCLADMLTKMPRVRIGNSHFSHKLLMPGIVCKDGTKLSVQASAMHYSHPRNNRGPYKTVEVGYPTAEPPLAWKQYAEDWEDPTVTVYGYVPLELVCFYIAAHGGIDADKTFEGFKFELL